MNALRRLRALAVVSVVWGFLAASLYMVFGAVNGVGAPVMPAISEILSVFILAWAVFMAIGVIVGLGLIAVAQGRRLQELSSWRVAGAGALGGFCLLYGLMALEGELAGASFTTSIVGYFPAGMLVASMTGLFTVWLAALARLGNDRDALQDIDGAGFLGTDARCQSLKRLLGTEAR